jgi:hypothetical protein
MHSISPPAIITRTTGRTSLRCLLLLTSVAAAAGPTHGPLAEGPVSAPSFVTSSTNIGPKIQFAGTNFDFGKVDSGAIVKHDFILTNVGDQVLEITNVRPACGCTTAGHWDRSVKPGQTGIIPIQFNTAGYGGEVLKTISVSCNDPAQTNLTLQLKGTAWKAIDVSPLYAMFNLLADTRTNETRAIRIRSNLEEPLTLSEPVCTNATFRAEVKTVEPGKEFELRVTVVPPLDSPSVTAPVTLKTSSSKMPEITVTAFAMTLAAVAVNPPQLSLPPGPLASPAKLMVSIHNNTTNALILSDPSINAPDADVLLKETITGRLYSLLFTFPAGFQIEPGRVVEASVKSNNREFPVVKVPVHQRPAAAGSPQPTPAVPQVPASQAAAPKN